MFSVIFIMCVADLTKVQGYISKTKIGEDGLHFWQLTVRESYINNIVSPGHKGQILGLKPRMLIQFVSSRSHDHFQWGTLNKE